MYIGGHWYNHNIQYIQNMQLFGPPVFTTRVDSTDIMLLALLNLCKCNRVPKLINTSIGRYRNLNFNIL